MAKSIFTPQYDRLRELLVDARRGAGMTQADLAECLKRPQSYVSKYERAERRLDVVEFLEIARCVGIDGPGLIRTLESGAKPATRAQTNGDVDGSAQIRDGRVRKAGAFPRREGR